MHNPAQFYSWKDYRCAYTVHSHQESSTTTPALLLIHPIGVGLSRLFWQRFIQEWMSQQPSSTIYNPDLLGCGECDFPSLAYYPLDWASQLKFFIEQVVKQPVILVSQGASLPIAIKLTQIVDSQWISGLILSAPPAWRTITDEAKPQQQKLLWNLLFNSPVGLGKLFYLYARRRQFIESFSIKQLFAQPEQVDTNWLDQLTEGALDPQSRYAVFSFLAGFWREDYEASIAQIAQPTLVVFGEQSSSISSEGKSETVPQRLEYYMSHLPQGQGCIIPGRNVLPYESTSEFVKVAADFFDKGLSLSYEL
ncbi:MAG: alpha/beta fold hydrolase [Cyanobacteria bacterium J06621_8]